MKLKKENINYNIKQYFFIIILLTGKALSGQPVANFTAAPLSGCTPLTVNFTDQSSGNPTTWSWNLGNGTISGQRNPTTTFFTPGTYTITLTASNANGINTITKNQYITVYDKPTVNFTASDTSTCVPINIRFHDLSSTSPGSISSWKWDFDDGSFSTVQHPQHFYNTPGNYNITLKVTNAGGCSNSLTKLAYIKASDAIRATFSFKQGIKCKPPETIFFTNSSAGPGILNFSWDFGDGGTSTAGAPNHTYLTGGLFSVRLIVKNNSGCKDTLFLRDSVKIKNVQSKINGPDTLCRSTTTNITNGTIPAPLSCFWHINDGTIAFGPSVTKNWDSAGIYSIKLVNNYSTCSDSVIKTITVRNLPVADFFCDDSNSCKPPLTVHFTDASANAASWQWNYIDGLGNTSVLQNPVYSFQNTGKFDIVLSITDSFGCTGSTVKNKLINISKPVAGIDVREGGGCIPYSFSPAPAVTTADGVAGYFWDFGDGTTSTGNFPVATYTSTGNYTIKLAITTNDGCRDSVTIVDGVKTGTPPVVDFAVAPALQCPGALIQFSDLSIPADRWLWKFGDRDTSTSPNPQHFFLDSGRYSVKLIAWNNGCSDSVTKPSIITILPGRSRFRPVYNCLNKKEVFFKDSSIVPQSWLWDFGDGNTSILQNPTHLFAGYQNYTVSLTTTSGICSHRSTQVIKLVNEVPDFIASKDSMCKSDSAFFYLANLNKANIKGYIWDYGDGTTDTTSTDSSHHKYTLPGRYTVKLTATDIHGCSETTIKPKFIHVFGPRAGYTITAAGGCLNQAVNFTDTSSTVSGHNNIAQWSWNFGDGQSQTFGTPPPLPVKHIYTGTGNYYPFLKIIDSLGCSDSISYPNPITIYQPVANFYSPNYNTCARDTVVFRNPSTGSGLTYLWTFGDGTSSTVALPVKQYLTNGDYTVRLMVTDASGCKDSLEKINYIRVKDVQAFFTVSDSTGNCTPFQVNFTNSSVNGLSQKWDFGDGGFSTAANPVYYYTVPGIYDAKLTLKRSNNCISTYSRKIWVKAPVAHLTYSPLTGCSPLQVTFHVETQDSLTYLWDLNDGTSFLSTDTTITHNYLLPGSFLPKVVLQDAAGCAVPLIGKDSIRLYSSKVNFGASNTVLCDNGSVTFSDSTISGSAVAGYRWDFGDGSNSILQNPLHLYPNLGLYTIKLFITTVYGCKDSIVKNNFIKVIRKPAISITGATSYCGPSAILLQGNLLSADSSAINWKWDFNNGNTSLLQNPPAQQYNDTGIYIVRLIAVNSSGCSDTAFTPVVIKPLPNVSAGNDTAICLNASAPLLATGADFYEWQPVTFLSCNTCRNVVATPPNSTTFYVKGSTAAGCEKTDSVIIVVKKPFRMAGLQPVDSVCAGKSIQLHITGAEIYSWVPAAGLNNSAIGNPVAAPAAGTSYKVIGFDSINCFKDSALIFIKVNSKPYVNAGTDKLLNAGNTVTLTPQYAGNITSWLWQPATGLNCTDCPNPVAKVNNDITYTVKVTNGGGCVAEDDIFIRVSCNRNNLFLPTAFTPNHDPLNLNELFYPIGTGVFRINVFKIYNRNGQLVFVKGNFYPNDKNAGWDGFYNGKPAPQGNYIYTIEFTCENNEVVSFNGNILLLR